MRTRRWVFVASTRALLMAWSRVFQISGRYFSIVRASLTKRRSLVAATVWPRPANRVPCHYSLWGSLGCGGALCGAVVLVDQPAGQGAAAVMVCLVVSVMFVPGGARRVIAASRPPIGRVRPRGIASCSRSCWRRSALIIVKGALRGW